MLKSNPSADLIKEQIELHGPMSFARFVDLALYHPLYGYYSRTLHPRGREGDYFTSMQAGGLLPAVMADVFLDMKAELGTEQFHVIEFGSGSGEFLEGVMKEFERRKIHRGFHFWAIERSPKSRELLLRKFSRFRRARVIAGLDEIPYVGGLEGCFFSNEFFDALPFHRLRRRGDKWMEIYVGIRDGAFVEVEKTPSRVRLPAIDEPAEEQEIEIRPEVETILRSWGAQLLRGYVVTFDYGYPRADLYHPVRKDGTWRCFSRHTLNASPYERIGRQDITAHIDFTQLAHAAEEEDLRPGLFCSQGIFLSHAGKNRIQALLDSGGVRTPGSILPLLRPDAMGEKFHVLAHQKNAALPPLLSEIPNRLKRLS